MTKHEINKLINSISAGDTEAVEVLYNEISMPVYFYVLHILKNKFAAEDVMQETFLTVLQKSNTYVLSKNPMAWIFAIAKNKSIDYLRRQQKIVTVDINEIELFSDNFDEYLDADYPEMLNCLNEKERDIVVLRVLSGFTLTQIARDLDLPKGSVFWTYNNAMKKLKRTLNAGGNDNVS